MSGVDGADSIGGVYIGLDMAAWQPATSATSDRQRRSAASGSTGAAPATAAGGGGTIGTEGALTDGGSVVPGADGGVVEHGAACGDVRPGARFARCDRSLARRARSGAGRSPRRGSGSSGGARSRGVRRRARAAGAAARWRGPEAAAEAEAGAEAAADGGDATIRSTGQVGWGSAPGAVAARRRLGGEAVADRRAGSRPVTVSMTGWSRRGLIAEPRQGTTQVEVEARALVRGRRSGHARHRRSRGSS